MNPDTPITLAAARYSTRDAAVADWRVLKGVKTLGDFDHMAVAVLTKDDDGKLQIERHDTTSTHLAWIGAALVVIAPPVGVTAIASGAATGALVGHFWHNIPKEQVREAAELLENGESGLVVVAVNRKGSEVKSLLARADQAVIIDTVAGDLDAEMDKAVSKAKAAERNV
jgi:uncharacterized membrane protein